MSGFGLCALAEEPTTIDIMATNTALPIAFFNNFAPNLL
tara:strand:- start:80 stop:196 length:117 start_codon:yes stop_codon:yes gene_type:complete